MTNEQLLRNIWRDEVVNSKKKRLLRSLSQALGGMRESQARKRVLGLSKTNDAEFFCIIEIFKSNNINTTMYEEEIRKKRCKYFGEYESVDLA